MKTKLNTKRVAKRKPSFTRQQSSYKKFNKIKWRYPRGKHSKIRLNISGHKVAPSIGYGSPRDTFGLNKHGLTDVVVTTLTDLNNIDSSQHSIVLSGKLGTRKRIILLEKIKSMNLKVMNIKDIDAYISNVKAEMHKKKEEKKSLLTKKKEVKKEVKEEEKELSQEDKDKELKEIQRKVLEKKQ